MGLNKSGRLGLLVSLKEPRGGSSSEGEAANRGETEKVVPLSETRDGAPSIDSAREASETDGDGSGISVPRWDEKPDEEIARGRVSAGLAKERVCDRSSKLLWQCDDVLRRSTSRRRRFMLPFHQFFTALSLRPCSLRAISAQRFPISATNRSI